MVKKADGAGYVDVMDGIGRKTLVYGENMLLTEFRLDGGKTLSMHKHPQEQTGYLVSGHIILTIGGKPHDMRPGDSWSIPGNVEHGAEVVEDSVAIEVFSPVREDYKP
ncbi:MAG TPA: cupin domain-containing protein [Methanocella sp.]|uniref:cupin domain-containing protein n=1 Tax=Methanocella sp. TaxID=2052833 RepID=UPI002B8DB46F|nr:cupin domain-containing protein [Methanocella sp.]HTY89938.1 cupin domain-containing protein [Methanocella sp.]